MPLEAIVGSPILMKAQAVSIGTSTPFEATLLLAMMSLAAAVGPTRVVYNPLGYNLPVSMNAILITESSALLSGVAHGEFAAFDKLIQAEVRRAGHEDSRRRGEDTIQTRMQLLMAEDVLSRRRMPHIELGELSARDPVIAAEQTARAMPYALKETEALRTRLETTLAGLMLASFPDFIAHELTMEELSEPQRVSFDSAVLNLSFSGGTLRSVLGASPLQLVQLGRTMAASWAGTAPFSLSAARSHRPLVSNLWFAGREEARAFLENRTFIDHGISPSFIAVEAQPITAPDPSAMGDPDAWDACINFFLNRRFLGHQTKHWLADDAVPYFLKFVLAVDALIPELPKAIQCSGKHWPDLALKIAVLLDLGGYNPSPPPDQPTAGSMQTEPVPAPCQIISAATLAFAVALTKRVIGAQIRMLTLPDTATLGGHQRDREVEKMWGKLKCSGPATQRDLFRRYSKQKSDSLMPVLLRGLAAGRIVREGRLFTAVDFSVSKSVSDSAASSVSDGDLPPTHPSDNTEFKNGD